MLRRTFKDYQHDGNGTICDESVKKATAIWLLYRLGPEGADPAGKKKLMEEISTRQAKLGGFVIVNK